MTARMRIVGLGSSVLLMTALTAYCTGTARMVRRSTGLPDRDQIAQWWVHRGARVTAHFDKPPLVFLISGQSNAGNYGRGAHRTEPGVYNAFQGHLYLAQDPLLGSDGLGISPWILFSRKLLMRGPAHAVVLALAVRGGTGVRAWTEGGSMRLELFERLQDLRTIGLAPDFVLWQQGESDAPPYNTEPGEYADSLRNLIRSLRRAGVRAPVLIAQATRNRYHPLSPPLRQAQWGLLDPGAFIVPGPDVDRLGPEFRYDGVHFSESGVVALSQMWLDAVVAAQQNRSKFESRDVLLDNNDKPSY